MEARTSRKTITKARKDENPKEDNFQQMREYRNMVGEESHAKAQGRKENDLFDSI
jgi:hypothetical protein